MMSFFSRKPKVTIPPYYGVPLNINGGKINTWINAEDVTRKKPAIGIENGNNVNEFNTNIVGTLNKDIPFDIEYSKPDGTKRYEPVIARNGTAVNISTLVQESQKITNPGMIGLITYIDESGLVFPTPRTGGSRKRKRTRKTRRRRTHRRRN